MTKKRQCCCWNEPEIETSTSKVSNTFTTISTERKCILSISTQIYIQDFKCYHPCESLTPSPSPIDFLVSLCGWVGDLLFFELWKHPIHDAKCMSLWMYDMFIALNILIRIDSCFEPALLGSHKYFHLSCFSAT